MKLNTTVTPFILRGVHLLGIDSANCPMALRQKIWNKLAVEWRPDRVHDQVRTIDFDELPTHFDPYLKGMVRGRTVVRVAADTHVRYRRQVPAYQQRTADRVPESGIDPMRHTPSSTGARSPTATRFWRERGRARSIGRRRSRRCSTTSRPPFAQWFVGGTHEPVPQRGRPASRRARRPAGAGLHLDRDRAERSYTYRELHDEVNAFAAMLKAHGVGARRSRADLHADDCRGGVRDARVRAHRRDSFGRVRRLRGREPRDAHRRCASRR